MIPFIVSTLTSLLLCLPTSWLLRRWQIIDVPNARSSHVRPVLRGAGSAVILTIVLVGSVWPGWADRRTIVLGGSAAVLAAVSFLDDIRSLSPKIRFAFHAGAACACLLTLSRGQEGRDVDWPLFPVGFLWLAGYLNAFNFMDGINGLATLQALVTGMGTALIAWMAGAPASHPAVILSLVVSGAAAGFLPYNFPRAQMFLGDAGSAPLGFLLAFLGWWLAHDVGWWLLGLLGLIHANFILDTAITLARRVIRKERWLESHREHFYQRLVRAGRSHGEVTGWETILQLIATGAAAAAVRSGWTGRWVLGICVCGMWGLFFGLAERLFRRSGQ
ncbi:MAG TPA: glycosyltransferase family 4 protein [Candidatus Didemnitutus sp.]|jgi:UDP-N-acetylmuramyl pentapeptide phosphotransferase/UDP-N-acetylglucosamine-1-phosphate transferase